MVRLLSLGSLLANDLDHTLVGSDATVIGGIATDSREVSPGDLFVAIRGESFDGHQFIQQAVERGAAAVVCEKSGAFGIPVVIVSDSRDALWRLARTFFGDPTAGMKLVGVTGTNGKTSFSYMLRAILDAWGGASMVVGTLGASIGSRSIPLQHTTPEAHDLVRLLAQGRDEGIRAAVMEVSSHGIAMKRVQGCRFDVGVLTNITQDHLDFHRTMEDYVATKLRLFTELGLASGKEFVSVLNIDDHHGRKFAKKAPGRAITFGVANDAQVRASNLVVGPSSVAYRVETPSGGGDVTVPVGGHFNVSNSLASIAAALALEVPLGLAVNALAGVRGVPGRFEAVPTGREFSVIVDYAHTPDALQKLIRSARELMSRRVILVFGCGGDRDAEKRPKMGAIAAQYADDVILTSDNPRSENPEAIIRDIAAGIGPNTSARVGTEPDRRAAIAMAVGIAEPGDIVLVAGKGHEDYQIVGAERLPFDDRLVVAEILRSEDKCNE